MKTKEEEEEEEEEKEKKEKNDEKEKRKILLINIQITGRKKMNRNHTKINMHATNYTCRLTLKTTQHLSFGQKYENMH